MSMAISSDRLQNNQKLSNNAQEPFEQFVCDCGRGDWRG